MAMVKTCPHCSVKIRVPETLLGKKVRCQKCESVFLIPVDDEAETPTPKKKAVKPTAETQEDNATNFQAEAPRIAKRKIEEELVARVVDDDDDRPRRKRLLDEEEDDEPREIRKKKRKKKANNSTEMIAIIAGVGFLALAFVGGGIAYFIGHQGGEAVAVNQAPQGQPQNPLVNIARRVRHGQNPRPQFDDDDEDFRGVRQANAAGPKRQFLGNAKKLTLQNGSVSVQDRLNVFDPAPRNDGRRCKAFRVDLEAGNTYIIEMKSNVIDSFLFLLNPDGVEIADDDDSGADLDSWITIQIDRTGTYEIHASSFEIQETGAFTLSVRKGN